MYALINSNEKFAVHYTERLYIFIVYAALDDHLTTFIKFYYAEVGCHEYIVAVKNNVIDSGGSLIRLQYIGYVGYISVIIYQVNVGIFISDYKIVSVIIVINILHLGTVKYIIGGVGILFMTFLIIGKQTGIGKIYIFIRINYALVS